jgi:hypothetical protein
VGHQPILFSIIEVDSVIQKTTPLNVPYKFNSAALKVVLLRMLLLVWDTVEMATLCQDIFTLQN